MDPIKLVLNVSQSYGVADYMDTGGAYLTARNLEIIGFLLDQDVILVFEPVHDFEQTEVERVDFEIAKLFH